MRDKCPRTDRLRDGCIKASFGWHQDATALEPLAKSTRGLIVMRQLSPVSCVSVVPCRSRGELRMLAWLMARAKEDGATATTTTRRGPRWRSTMAVAGRVLGNVRLGGSGGWSAGRAASGPVSSAQEAASRMEPPDQRHPAQPTQMVFHARPSACPPPRRRQVDSSLPPGVLPVPLNTNHSSTLSA